MSGVVAIDRGVRERDIVTDDDYESIANAQDAMYYSQQFVREKTEEIANRLAAGARDLGVKYRFDEDAFRRASAVRLLGIDRQYIVKFANGNAQGSETPAVSLNSPKGIQRR
jgi:hypothetical protein